MTPVGVSLSGAEVEGIRGWRRGLGLLSATMKFEVDAPVISDLSEGITNQQIGTARLPSGHGLFYRASRKGAVWQGTPCSWLVGLAYDHCFHR